MHAGHTFQVRDPAHCRHVNAEIDRVEAAGHVPEVIVRPYDEKRNKGQNSLIYAIYKEFGLQVEGENPKTIMRYCKLHHGIPLLRLADQKFRNQWDKSIGLMLTYEEQLEAMDWFPVTRLMSKRQCSDYIDAMVADHARRGYYLKTDEYEGYA